MKMLTAINAEQMKHKHRLLLLLPAALLFFEFVWLVWGLDPKKPSDLTQGYLSAFYMFPILNSLIYPIFLAVLVNRICDMEIKGDTLKLLYTLEDKKTFYNCKYFMSLKYIILTSAGTCLIPWIIGKLYGFTDTLKPHMLLQLALSTFVVSTAILSIQQLLSLLSSNQILPLVVGLAGSFLSLFSMFFPPVAARLILWGYYGIFGFVGMDWERSTRITTYYEVNFSWMGLLFFAAFSIVIYFLCRSIALRKEV